MAIKSACELTRIGHVEPGRVGHSVDVDIRPG